ncbi:MAG: xanthine dehydrogenase family protein molybdopterin-binding subunit [Nitrospinota bacterium]|nr:MAG: xanthine dehydrogenase family protein molybdopterin-binding subunit [Nitrospinota bacterium]
MPDRLQSVGRQAWRKDGVARVTGQEEYTSDISLPRMLHARVLRSPHPHARVLRIDTGQAEALGAVCLTFDDIPKVRYNERLVSVPEKLYRDRYVLPDKIRHVGEPVAAVAAETEALAEKALRALRVEYELLPAVIDPQEAMQPAAPQLYETILVGEEEVPIENNVACRSVITQGDVEAGFAGADLILEEEFRTGRVYHAQLENKGVVVKPEADGGITVWPTAQSIHNVRILLGEIFGIPLHKINVHRVPIGGAFGSSIQTNTIIPIGVALALKARRPVKLVQTREEDWHDHVRYPTVIRLRLGVKEDGTLVAGEMQALVDIGAHNIQAFPFLEVLAGFWVSLYRLPNVKYEGVAVYTNKVPTCAMRGFGAPQVHLAMESMMDMIAERLGIDPIALRLKNYRGLGDTFWGQGPTVLSVIKSDGVPELLQRGAQAIGWERRGTPAEKTGRYRRGIGMARGFHTSGTGAPRPGHVIDASSAFVKVNEDGSVDVVTSLMDQGGGTLDAIAKIVAETLGVPLSRVGIAPADTRSTAYDVATHATRGVYVGGGAAYRVALRVRDQLLRFAGQLLNVQPDALTIRPDEETGQGIIYCESLPEKRITIGELAAYARARSQGTFQAAESFRPVVCPPAYVAHFVEVEVDTETGRIRPLRIVLGNDVGTVVNPDLAVGQMEGGFLQGLGYALLEDPRYDPETGQPLNRGIWTDGKIPTIDETPLTADSVTFFAQTHEPTGPFGAKGIGEAAMNPAAAAIVNAIYNAIGIRFTELPITPERVLEALQQRQAVFRETGPAREPPLPPRAG